jgi:signal transduction histidine kinase
MKSVMRRSAWIFLAAIVLPSLVLAWLAVRSARDQQVILEHQRAIISQDITDALAKRIREQLDSSQSEFIATTQQLLKQSASPQALAGSFHQRLRRAWNLADVGFAVNLNGVIYSPTAREGPQAAAFLTENARFISNRENGEVFAPSKPPPAPAVQSSAQQQQGSASIFQNFPSQNGLNQPLQNQAPRLVAPQKSPVPQPNNFSNVLPADSNFRRLIQDQNNGSLAQFREDKLRLMVWYRPPQAGHLVFGAQLAQPELVRTLTPLLAADSSAGVNYCLAILDDHGKPVALSRPDFQADWKHPLVATEIGEGLPHWEAALYLLDPQEIGRSASTLRLTLGSIVLALVAAILMGGWMMAIDARRQMVLAHQKTDFVSNVSHELKTPLTSIRMFADMLAEGRVEDLDRRHQYLRIIAAESARLTRLINNVLNFARLERGGVSVERQTCDLAEIAKEVMDTSRPHLEDAKVRLNVEADVPAMPLMGDRDALGQIVLNLLSNAEKYGGGEVLVRLRREERGTRAFGCVDVLDRGAGVAANQRRAIFEPFHRVNESLSSGVSGSGLGLTLARRMAQAHGGDVTYSPREGGGSCFTLRLPL